MNRFARECARLVPILFIVGALAACGGNPDKLGTSPPPTPTDGGTPLPTPTGGGTPSPAGSDADVTAPSAAADPAGGPLDKSQSIVVRFSESMDPASLSLGGELGPEAVSSWSKGGAENDTLTLTSSNGTWKPSSTKTLVLDARDVAGNAMATLRANYVIPVPFATFQPASAVIGQADFIGLDENQGATAAANTLAGPRGVAISPDGAVFVSDWVNNRVLVYTAIQTQTNAAADAVLGQSSFTAVSSGVSKSRLDGPMQLSIGAGKMVLADSFNNRVLVYNSAPAHGELPDLVLGQKDFDSNTAGCSANELFSPEAAAIAEDGKVVVADTNNHRVLIWNQTPTVPGQAPDVVLGQPKPDLCQFNDVDQNGSSDLAPGDSTLFAPSGVWTDGKRLVVADSGNNRVLIWLDFPTKNAQAANIVLGQDRFTQNTPNDANHDEAQDVAPTGETLWNPGGVASNGVQLAVADRGNHRVLLWNTFPTQSFQHADEVLGQGGWTKGAPDDDNQDGSADGKASSRVFATPASVAFYRDQLFVVAADDNRVLIFKAP